MGICGGVNVLMNPSMFVALAKARMASPTGKCHTFSRQADGYARGEGCGVVFLKKLGDVGIVLILFNKIYSMTFMLY
jgi:acyl transferase domain-containing protein